jgi:septum formation inhibitor MinC
MTLKRYIERSGAAFERTTSEVAILWKENTEFRELLRIRKKRKKGKHVAIKGKFVFNTQEILELVEEAEAETLKRKLKKKRTIRATTLEIESKQEEDIEEDMSESRSNCIIVASSRLN